MTKVTIQKIPIRSKMTGEQVGTAIIESFVYDYIFQKREDYTPLYTADELQRMIAALPNQYERRVYTERVGLYNGIVGEFNRAQGAYQQAQNGYFILHLSLQHIWQEHRAISWLNDFSSTFSIDKNAPEYVRYGNEFFSNFMGLNSLKDDTARHEELTRARDIFLYPAMRSLSAYNVLIELIANEFTIPNLLHLQTDNITFFRQLQQYNDLYEKIERVLSPEGLLSFHAILTPLDPFYGFCSDSAEQSVMAKLKNPQNYEGGSLLRLMEELMCGR